jgi:sporulation protein YlmC with PRC-barrel domain
VATAVLEQQDVKSVLGRQVRSITGEDMGRVVNVVVDRSGQVRAAIPLCDP